jgi:hypothetical protein
MFTIDDYHCRGESTSTEPVRADQPLSLVNLDRVKEMRSKFHGDYFIILKYGTRRPGTRNYPHDWLLGYYYAHIEILSVNASYAQDDWIRFGSGTQTDASDFEGHEIRLGYALSANINLLARLYLVDAITTRQDGKRFRVDLNWRF